MLSVCIHPALKKERANPSGGQPVSVFTKDIRDVEIKPFKVVLDYRLPELCPVEIPESRAGIPLTPKARDRYIEVHFPDPESGRGKRP